MHECPECGQPCDCVMADDLETYQCEHECHDDEICERCNRDCDLCECGE